VTGVRRIADSVTLTLRPNANWRGFSAGQHVRVTVEIDGVRRTRPYSPACSAHAGAAHLELTVKAHPDGEVSRFLNDRAAPGMVLGLSQAEGDFTLPAARPRQLLLISGGSGITPVMSMLRTLCDEGHQGAVTFLHYAPGEHDGIYGSELAELAARHANVRLLRAYTRQGGGELAGRFTREQLLAAVPDHAEAETYVCGPSGLVEAVRSTWAEDGLEARLRVEYFDPPPLAVPTGEAGGSVHFAGSDLRAANSGASLLEQAEAAGLAPEHGCRMGICHSCTCRKTAGTVRNAVTGELSSATDEDIQICVSVPVGDVTLDI
jgi:ferredoxin-NADP reductase